jgi:hypothetical protein
MQKRAEERSLVICMDEDVLRGWSNISNYWGVSIITMMKLAVKYELPVVRIEGEVYAFKSKLDEKRVELMNDENNLYYRTKKKKG